MIYNKLKDKWWDCSSKFDLKLHKISYLNKKKNEKQFNKIIEKLYKYVSSIDRENIDYEKVSAEGKELLKEYIKIDPIFKLNLIHEDMREDIINVTEEFVKAARGFDKNISKEDIGQAMRNVWIINLLQGVLGFDVEFNDAIFAYSMLYPYTDNYLDNKDITMEEKKVFNDKFYRRLKGEKLKETSNHEKQVYKLVEKIEGVFSRDECPMVYDSLLSIHKGQVKSLKQQGEETLPYERDILSISIEKGGASVLADGYLMKGNLTELQEEFCIGYGFILQIADDLQDVKSDKDNRSMTIMSQLAGRYDLDSLSNKLLNFTEDFLNMHPIIKESSLKEVIKSNCIFLILFSIVLSKEFFSKGYIKEIEKYLPFTLGYIEGLKDKFQK